MNIRYKKQSHCFSIKAEQINRVLVMDIAISQIEESKSIIQTKAIWDTGASSTVITKEIFDQLKLTQFGVATVSTASVSNVTQPTYLVDVYLKPDVRIQGLEVTVGVIAAEHGINCLIGMDIITLGDFSITNLDNKTCMSFRLPSQHEVDFVQTFNRQKRVIESHFASKRNFNNPCICGSGKKFKNCHGKDLEQA